MNWIIQYILNDRTCIERFDSFIIAQMRMIQLEAFGLKPSLHEREEKWSDDDIRSNIAQLLTARCNNCYSRLPGEIGCNVHSPGWNWLTPNFGPFCDDCWKEIIESRLKRLEK